MGNPRMNCVADDLHRRPLADRGSPGRTNGNAVTNPRIRVCSTVVLTALSPALRNRFIPRRPDLLSRDATRAPKIVDNEHQSSCARTGYPTASSNPTTTSSPSAATPGTGSSISHGRSCPSVSATGPIGRDQGVLVLYMKPLRQVFCDRHRNRVSAKIVVLSDVRSEPASSSWPIAVCTSGWRIVLNAVRRIGCNQYVPRSPVRPDLVNHWRDQY